MRHRFQFKVGVALGGGAARGLAHLGVLRALERAEIPIDIVVGTSIGSILGGAYAALGNAGVLEEKVRQVLTSDGFRKNRLLFLRETRRERGGVCFAVAKVVRRGIGVGVSRDAAASARRRVSSRPRPENAGNVTKDPLP